MTHAELCARMTDIAPPRPGPKLDPDRHPNICLKVAFHLGTAADQRAIVEYLGIGLATAYFQRSPSSLPDEPYGRWAAVLGLPIPRTSRAYVLTE